MKRPYGPVLLVLIVFLAGCGEPGEARFRQEKRQFTIVMSSKLDQFKRRTAELATSVGRDSVRAVEVDSLRLSQEAFREKVATIKGSTPAEWKELKPTMESQYYDLERRYYEIASAAAAQEAVQASADSLQVEAVDGVGDEERSALAGGAMPAAADSTKMQRGE